MDNYIAVLIVILIVVVAYFHQKKLRRQSLGQTQPPTIAIFHPWCSDGGGGERVLWCMVDALLSKNTKRCKIYIYTDGNIDKNHLISQIKYQFDIVLNPDSINLIPISYCKCLKPAYYPVCTLLLQNLASVLVAINAAYNFEPDVFIDTTGFAFMYPIFKLFCFSKIVAYVHYPIITTDMMEVVRNRKSSFNNNIIIARVKLLTKLKLIYYHMLSYIYYWCGTFANVVMVNGKWTQGHIEKLWCCSNRLHRVFPPCGLVQLDDDNDVDHPREPIIISLGQFRPEKDHKSQLFIFKKIIDTVKDEKIVEKLELHLIGGCRNNADYYLLDNLTQLAIDLGIEKRVKFLSNLSSDQLKNVLRTSMIGIHTMRDEHFGISVVEMAAAGVVVIAHKSGGPMLDILYTDPSIENGDVGGSTGFLADSNNEYVLHLSTVLSMTQEDLHKIRMNARTQMKARFSDEVFKAQIVDILGKLII